MPKGNITGAMLLHSVGIDALLEYMHNKGMDVLVCGSQFCRRFCRQLITAMPSSPAALTQPSTRPTSACFHAADFSKFHWLGKCQCVSGGGICFFFGIV